MGKDNDNGNNDSSEPDDKFFEKYREHHEPVEHWELRREFIKKNWDTFSENRLLCLSKTFANMEFLGCKYPMETMELVSELSRGVVEDYREQKMKRIQRTFVKASDAAEKKSKGKKSSRTTMEFIQSQDKGPESESSSSRTCKQDYAQMWPIQTRFTVNKVTTTIEIAPTVPSISQKNVALQSLLRLQGLSLNAISPKSSKTISAELQDDIMIRLNQMVEEIQIVQPQDINSYKGPFVEIRDAESLKKILRSIYVIRPQWEDNEATTLTQTFSACQMHKFGDFVLPKVDLSLGIDCRCDFVIGDPKNPSFIAHGTGCGKKEARRDAAIKALEFIQHIRPTILIKDAEKRRIERSDVVPNDQGTPKLLTPKDLMCSDSVAVKMMLQWGWRGGGLGRNQDGRLFPIDTSYSHINRAGLGMKKNYSKQLETNVLELLRIELESLYDYDIEFAPDFTTDERKIIHNVAERYGFKNKSYGQGSNRRLVISRKIEPHQIFEEVMKVGGENFKYKVVLPESSKTSPKTVEKNTKDV